jgi:hypothetical protein
MQSNMYLKSIGMELEPHLCIQKTLQFNLRCLLMVELGKNIYLESIRLKSIIIPFNKTRHSFNLQILTGLYNQLTPVLLVSSMETFQGQP